MNPVIARKQPYQPCADAIFFAAGCKNVLLTGLFKQRLSYFGVPVRVCVAFSEQPADAL